MKKQCISMAVLLAVLAAGPLHAQDQNPPAEQAQPEQAESQRVPMITFDETPLEDVIKLLSRQAGINVVMDPKLSTPGEAGVAPAQAQVSVRFESVTPEEALNTILDNHGLQLVANPKTRISRITTKLPPAEAPLVTKIYSVQFASVTNMVDVIRPTLGTRSVILADSRTGKLVVRATEDEITALDALIENLDTATKQVLIEARIIETTRNPRSIRGIDWSGTLEAQELTFGNNVTADGVVLSPGVIAGRRPGGSFQFQPTSAFLNASGVEAVMSFINKDTDAEVISMPRTVTLDNQMARLEVTRAFPIFEVAPSSANVPPAVEITYTNLGTILEVTPRIASYSNISLRVVPEVSDIAAIDRQTYFGDTFTANIYAIRRMETTVMIPSGNTLVLGGLISGDTKRDYSKVPILGDIPGIGGAFRHQNKRKTKANLLIFITPTIVESTDFQRTETTFLQTPIIEDSDEAIPRIDSAKPLKRRTRD